MSMLPCTNEIIERTEHLRNHKVPWMLGLAIVLAVANFRQEMTSWAALPAMAAQNARRQVTAREDLANATEAARAWHGDAALCRIGGVRDFFRKRDLAENAWIRSYSFCAKAAKQQPEGRSGERSEVAKFIRDSAAFHRSQTEEATDCTPLPRDFVDSDRAMAEAKRAGWVPSWADRIWLGWDKMGLVWDIRGGGVSYLVDAQTGKLRGIERHAIPL